MQNIDLSEEISENYECEDCFSEFQTTSGLRKHKLKCSSDKTNNSFTNKKIKKLLKIIEDNIRKTEEQTKEFTKELTQKTNQITELNDELIKKDNQINELKIQHKLELLELENKYCKPKNENTIGNFLNNKSKAKPLTKLKEISKLFAAFEPDNAKYSFEYIAMHNYNKNQLHVLLGKFILAQYKKDDCDQAMWCSDVSRYSYYIKGESKWIYNSKATDVINIVIQPLVKYVEKRLNKFVTCKSNEFSNNVKQNKSGNGIMMTYMNCMDTANDIIKICGNGSLAKLLLEYITPFLVYNKKPIS